jgi:hypothetical protein
MKKAVAVMILAILSSSSVFAYISGIAIQTEKSSNMQVYINGKLYNKKFEKFVRIKSLPGLFHVRVKVLNPHDKNWYIVRKDIKVLKGFEYYYKMVFAKGKAPQIVAIKKYPVYSRYFLNPILYNKHPIT